MCNFSVATNRRWTNQDASQTAPGAVQRGGSQGEETVWWTVSAWDKLGEVCDQYLEKGRQVYIEGRLEPDRTGNNPGGPRIWTDRNGQPRASFELRALTVKFLSGRGDADVSGGTSAQQTPGGNSSDDDFGPEDIPF